MGLPFFERLMNFKNVGEGSFEPRAGIKSPLASMEDQSSLVTTIMCLPPWENPVTDEAVGKDDCGEVRVSSSPHGKVKGGGARKGNDGGLEETSRSWHRRGGDMPSPFPCVIGFE